MKQNKSKNSEQCQSGSYVKEKMVNWYKAEMLAHIALKALVSGVFGNYADRRELQAALGKNSLENSTNINSSEYLKENDIWIDIVSDTGDGFSSTFAIAKTVSQKELSISMQTGRAAFIESITHRGQILIFGGDEVYPYPTMDAYKNRFKVPFESAADCQEKFENEDDHPEMYAIPGNHDWYDGLGNFLKIFCQQRSIGIWRTKQTRSYFAIPIRHNCWIWATDIQLNSDIDKPQLEYFKDVAINKMKEGDVIILITAEPAWIYNQIKKSDKSFERLQFFKDHYIQDAEGKIGKKFKLAATITGDLHHYARYCNEDNKQGHQFITAGGGGAFLHLTHNLPSSLNLNKNDSQNICIDTIVKNNVKRQKIYPNAHDSKRLLSGNFLFPFKNFRFTLLFLLIYFCFFWIIKSNPYDYFDKIATASSLGLYSAYSVKMFLHSPFTAFLTILLIIGFYKFSDTNIVRSSAAKWAGGLHTFVQVILLYGLIYVLSMIVKSEIYITIFWPFKGLIILIICFACSLIGGFVMGCYLFFSNIKLGMHINEASSSLASPDYKNFLRLHINEETITIYPVGIKKVPRKWLQKYDKKTDTYSFSGNKIDSFLIEEPIIILRSKLK